LKRELAYNIRGAGKLIEDGAPEVWEILEEVIDDSELSFMLKPTDTAKLERDLEKELS
jgi:hypothetical protein